MGGNVREIEHCWIPVGGGRRLAARVWLPEAAATRPVPAVFEYIPYRKRDMVRARDERNHPAFAAAGYAALRVDMVGSGDSDGLMADMYGREERADAHAIIEWIASQPWSDGAVGMMGTSWGGTASLQAARKAPEALKAIIAVCATNNRFADDIHHMGGLLLTDSIEWGATLPAILASPPDADTVGAAWRETWKARLDGLAFPLEAWIAHETRDAYWRQGSLDETPGAIEIPVLAIGGWADRYSNTVMNLLGEASQAWGIVGPWGHHYPDVAEPGPGIDFQAEAIRWWDRWLKGAPNGVDEAPRLRAWMNAAQAPLERVARRAGRWVEEPRWPPASSRALTLHLTPAGLAENAYRGAETAVIPFDLRVGAAAGDTGYFGRPGGLPGDQAEDDRRSLAFETEPLEAPVEILGRARLEAEIETGDARAMVAARLCDVSPDGVSRRVSWTVQNLALDAEGGAPASTATRDLAFPNAGYRFEAGHRIRLALSASYWPLIWPSVGGAALTLSLQGARLTLPIREGAPASLGETVEAAAPSTPASIMRWAREAPRTGRLESGWRLPYGEVKIAAIDLDFGVATVARFEIDPRDPTSARARYDHSFTYRRGSRRIEIDAWAAVAASAAVYRVVGGVTARENDAEAGAKTWRLETPRRFS